MITYEPKYNTELHIITETKRLDTQHTDYIDWSFPFDNIEHLSCRCTSEDKKRAELERQKKRLKFCEKNIGCEIPWQYGGKRTVVGVAMASRWPYWRPRPYVIINRQFLGTNETQWEDWLEIGKPEGMEEPK